MKKIYLNEKFECSAYEKADTVMSVETDFFDGKCDAYIEGYRFIPAGHSWTRKDGVVFEGEMMAPFKEMAYLDAVQTAFEELSGKIAATEEAVTNTELAIAELYEMGVSFNG